MSYIILQFIAIVPDKRYNTERQSKEFFKKSLKCIFKNLSSRRYCALVESVPFFTNKILVGMVWRIQPDEYLFQKRF